MKKLFLMFAVAGALAACNNEAETTTTEDSTTTTITTDVPPVPSNDTLNQDTMNMGTDTLNR